MTTATRASSRWDPDTLARLEYERDVLLRELRELDTQHAAGELDAQHYQRLHDELTARAADAIALVTRGNVAKPTRAPRRWTRLATAAVIAVMALLAGLLLTDQLAPRVTPAPPAADDAELTARVARLAAVVEAQPDDIPARIALGRLLLQEQDLPAARTQFDAIAELDPSHAEALAYAGWLATLTGDAEGGLERLDRAVVADPTYPDAHALRGLAMMRSNDSDGAVTELRRYLELAPSGPFATQVEAVIARLGAGP